MFHPDPQLHLARHRETVERARATWNYDGNGQLVPERRRPRRRRWGRLRATTSSGHAGIDPSARRIATVLFTDVVNSTGTSAQVGDRAWSAMLEQHHRIADRAVERYAGRVVKTTGDGLLVVFDVPSHAVAGGLEMIGELAEIGIAIRAGAHVGEIEPRDDGDIIGLTVNLAAKVAQQAATSELWVSPTLREMTLGADLRFEDRGPIRIAGLTDSWHLYSATASSATPRRPITPATSRSDDDTASPVLTAARDRDQPGDLCAVGHPES